MDQSNKNSNNSSSGKGLVSVVVINHNGMRFLKNFFSSFLRQTYLNYELIMVDNQSEDESVSFIESNYPSVKIVRNPVNSGYAGGSNLGLKSCKGEYIMIINNDVVVSEDLIEKLLDAYEEIPNLGAVQPMIKLIDDKVKLDACGSFWTNTGFNYHYGIYKKANLPIYNKKFPVYSLKGVCMLVTRKIIDEVGLFDDDFWCYFEETDFCHRVWLAGYECWYYPKSFLYHHMGGTRLKKAESFIQFHSFKNRLCSYLKNLGSWELIKILPVYFLLSFVWSAAHLLRLDVSGFLVVYKAFWWNVLNIRKTLKKRKYVQKCIRKKTDREIFSRARRNPRLSYYFYLVKGLKNYAD